MKKLYVAYGSNLNIAQMALRCPTAHIYGTGLLNNWELIYRGSMTGSYATIRRRKGSAVPVVVWSIMENDEKSLDIYEGYPRFYFKQNVMVDLPSGKKKAMVYIMDLKRKPGRPSQRYVESIREGYISNNLDIRHCLSSHRLERPGAYSSLSFPPLSWMQCSVVSAPILLSVFLLL